MPNGNQVRLIDTGQAPEIFCSALGRVENLGTVVRFTLYSESTAFGEREGIVNLKLVMPADSIQPSMILTLSTIGTLITSTVRRLIVDKLLH
jgi:hypothetical protein